MRTLITTLLPLLLFLAAPLASAQDTRPPGRFAAIEALVAEGSDALALERYEAVDPSELTGFEQRWVAFRRADLTWRAARSSGDGSRIDAALAELRALAPDDAELERRDLVWAEIQVSQADLEWSGGRRWSPGSAFEHYGRALDWWARSTDLGRARERWLEVFWSMARPEWAQGAFFTNYGRGEIPRRYVEQAIELARDAEERAQAQFALAQLLFEGAEEPRLEARAFDLLEGLAAVGRSISVHDDALFALAQRLARVGRYERDDDGRWIREPDPAGALVWYEQLVEAYDARSSGVWERAQDEIRDLRQPEIDVWTPGRFLPGSDLGYGLSWRNVDSARLTLRRIELDRDLEVIRGSDWFSRLEPNRLPLLAEWDLELDRAHARQSEMRRLELDSELPLGAYLLTAEVDGDSSRALLMVTDLALVLTGVGRDLTAWSVSAVDGQPLEGVTVTALGLAREGRSWEDVRSITDGERSSSDADGLTRFTLDEGVERVLVVARSGDSTAIVDRSVSEPGIRERTRVLATTDRPAYRPGQTARFSFVVRSFDDDGWVAPGGTFQLEIVGPRNEVVDTRDVTLSAFGTAAGELALDPNWALGRYAMRLGQGGRTVASGTLFQLEEYRLPDFRVSVELPRDDDGRLETFVLGDEVLAEVLAETYAGAPIGGADVEVVVRREAWSSPIAPLVRFAWFRPDEDQQRWWSQPEEVLRLELRTDDEGRATAAIPTSAFDANGWEYTLEARVTDQLRRVVTGVGTVRVGATAFRAQVELDHRIVGPGAPFEALVRTLDANDEPVAVDGALTLVRLIELTDAQFVERYGEDAVDSAETPRTVEEELERAQVRTDAEGTLRWEVTAPGEGAYVVRFDARDARSAGRVAAEASGFMADETSRDLGLRGVGLSLVVDGERFGEDETASAVLLSDRSGRAVLLTTASNGRVETRVVRMQRTATVLRFALEQRHVPSLTIRVQAVDGGQLLADQGSITIAPTRRVLDLQASLTESVQRPGATCELALRVLDADGEPVEGELSLSVFDSAVTAIREESTPDPRDWFYGKASVSFAETRASSLSTEHRVYRWDEDLRGLYDQDVVRVGLGGGAGGKFGGRTSVARGLTVREFEVLESLGYDGGSFDAGVSLERAESSVMLGAPPAAAVAAPAEKAPGAPNVRTDFRETALWLPVVRTDADGRATVEIAFPDSLTAWTLIGVVHDGASRFGFERDEIAQTSLPLLMRLGIPRFLVEGDEALLTTAIRNGTDAALSPEIALVVDSGPLSITGGPADGIDPLAADEERSFDWRVETDGFGSALLRGSVVADGGGDALERPLPVLEHGLEIGFTASGRLDAGRERDELTLDLPPAKPGTTDVRVTVTPSLAATAIEALPYLADYPYGCLEQTLSRFVPTVVTLDALAKLGFERGVVAQAAFDRPRTTQAQAGAEATLDAIDAMAAEGLARVLSMQTRDGGFSWWPGGSGDAFMSGYALWSLSLASGAGLDVPEPALLSAREFLVGRATALRESDVELAVWCLHAVVQADRDLGRISADEAVLTDFAALYGARETLGAYGRALLLRAAHALGRKAEVEVLVRNLSDGVVLEDGPGAPAIIPGAASSRMTARWGRDGIGYRWSQDGIEATAFSVLALLEAAPDHELIEPAIEWLVLSRRGAGWKSTRDTAICVLALIDATVRRGELERDGGFVLSMDGRELGGSPVLAGAGALTPLSWSVPDPGPGEHVFALERTGGDGPLYWSVAAETFTVEDRIAPRATELALRRDVQRLVGTETLLAGKVYDRVPLEHLDRVRSGDRVEVVLTFETRAPLEYVAIEDFKPAGFEAVETTSGYGPRLRQLRADEVERRFVDGLTNIATVGDALPDDPDGYTGQQVRAYRELRDTRVVHFVDRLPPGVWELRTTLRAETPGRFSALPARAHAMYAPDLRGNSAEIVLQVDR